MNCQEVMDLMQRQLDGDLDDRETESLTNHLRHCPECSAMFERLKLLSAGLDNLPKVTPSYSLVDAILPRLAEIKAAEEAGTTDIAEPDEQIEVVLPSRRTERTGSQQPRRRDRFSIRAIGGVVAAGIVVGLLIATHPFDSLNLGGGSNDVADSSSAADTASTSRQAPKQEMFFAQTEASSDGAAQSKKAPDSGGEAKDDAGNSSAAPNIKSAPGATPSRDQTGDSGEAAQAPAAADSHATRSGGENPTSDAGDGGQNLSPNFEISGGSGTGNQAGEANEAGSGNSGGAPASGGEAAPDTDGKPLSYAPAGPTESLSPDKTYKAAIVDAKLKIYRMEDNVLIFESAERPAGIRNMVWSKDGKTFTYETTSTDGSKVVYAVSPESQSEQQKTD